MRAAISLQTTTDTELASLDIAQLVACVKAQQDTIAQLKHQIEWFKRQLFGVKSERLSVLENAQQLFLGEVLGAPSSEVQMPTREVLAHTRRSARSDVSEAAESLPFFDESRVPVQTITLPAPEQQGLSADQYEVISEKVSFRLAQRAGSYVVLKYVRPVIKRHDTQQLSCACAPVNVIASSRAEVSFVVGVLVEKFAYHLPLYRQHQRLSASGITVSRPWLTQITQQSIALLEPIYEAQFDSIRASPVKAMDETPLKAGRAGPGKMKTGYLWPVYGEHDEVCFPFFPTRATACVHEALGMHTSTDAVLLSDGYAAYRAYAQRTGITQAHCWAHARREFFEAHDCDPDAVSCALQHIQGLYAVEEQIRALKLTGEDKRLHRLTHSKPILDEFFAWIDAQFTRHGLLPKNPFVKALNYARERRAGLEVFLNDPQVPIDTNHLERAIRPIPMGRKNWLFCWTELGAKQVGIIQSLMYTCRLHHIDPYTYLVDVLQRVSQHPAARVAELTPRLWKQHFAHNPLRSDLYRKPV